MFLIIDLFQFRHLDVIKCEECKESFGVHISLLGPDLEAAREGRRITKSLVDSKLHNLTFFNLFQYSNTVFFFHFRFHERSTVQQHLSENLSSMVVS